MTSAAPANHPRAGHSGSDNARRGLVIACAAALLSSTWTLVLVGNTSGARARRYPVADATSAIRGHERRADTVIGRRAIDAGLDHGPAAV